MAKSIILEKKSLYAKYLNYIVYPVVIVFVLFAALYGYISYTNRKAEKLYNSGLKVLSEALQKKVPDEAKLDKAKAILQKIVNKYPITKYHKLSLPFLGYISFLEGDYDKAISFYAHFKKKMAKSSVEYTSLTDLAISSCYEEKKDMSKAIKILKKFSSEQPESPFREFALLSLERLYRLSNKPSKAKQVLEEFVKEYPQSPFFYMAKAHLLSYNNIKK